MIGKYQENMKNISTYRPQRGVLKCVDYKCIVFWLSRDFLGLMNF